jgi:hypothetical protein
MANYAEKIQRFSRILYIFLMIAFVFQLIGTAVELLAWIFTKAEFQPLLQISGTRVYIPFMQGSDGAANSDTFLFANPNLWEVLKDICAVYLLGTAKTVFKLLRGNGSPYRDEVVLRFRRLTVAFIIMGFLSGFMGFLAAAICWILVILTDNS